MNLKSTFVAIAATTALTGAVLVPATVQAKPCFFSQQGGMIDSTSLIDPANPTTVQATTGDFKPVGIAGAILGSLFAGGMMLKRRFHRPVAPLKPTQAEGIPEPLSEDAFVVSEFAIEIPKAALQSARPSDEADLTSIR